MAVYGEGHSGVGRLWQTCCSPLTGNAAQILPPKMRHSGAVQVIQRARWMTSEQGLNIPTQHRDAYTVNGVFSEPFPTHAEALAAAREAAAEQRVPGHTEVIEYEDENGRWHTERASGRDRPETDVQDTN